MSKKYEILQNSDKVWNATQEKRWQNTKCDKKQKTLKKNCKKCSVKNRLHMAYNR